MRQFGGAMGSLGGGGFGRGRRFSRPPEGAHPGAGKAGGPALNDASFLLIPPPPELAAAAGLPPEGAPAAAGLLAAMPADMLPDGSFGEVWLFLDKERLRVFAPAAAGGWLQASEIAATDISSARLSSGLGCSVLEVQAGESWRRLLRFSNALCPSFSEFCRLLNEWRRDGVWNAASANLKLNVCPRCRRPLAANMSVCPRCLAKGHLLRRSLAFVRPYKPLVAMTIVLMLLSSLIALAGPLLGRYLVDNVLTPPLKMENLRLLVPLALAMFGVHVGQAVIDGWSRLISARLGTRTTYDVRGSLFRKLQELSLSYYAKKQTGTLITRVNQDSEQLHNLLVDFIPQGLNMVLTAGGILALLLYLSWPLTLCVLVPVVGMLLFIRFAFPSFRIYWSRFFEKRARLVAYVTDVITGARVVKAFGQEPAELRRFERHSAAHRDALYEANRKMAYTFPFLHAIAMAGTPLVWCVGGWMVFNGTMTLGGIVAFTGYLMMLFRPIFILSRLAEMIPNALAAAGRIYELLDAEAEIVDAPDSVPMPTMRGEIEFRNVSFGYQPHKDVLKGLSVRIRERETVGFVGHSGAGKTTAMNLICRFYDAREGEVLIDGVDIRKIRYDDLRRHLGIVLQETFLLNGSIADNIAYARPGATPQQVVDAARVANAHDFIIAKPEGYDTLVEEGGKNLSTGEKQRIAIARAVLSDPRILLLDEATASVDLETEKQIQEALERLTAERTTIMIAHRLSTLRNADRLLVLEKGELAEIGTHDELMAKPDGIYRRLADMYAKTSSIRAIAR